MSLINDALKRASQATTSAPPPTSAAPSAEPLRPVEYKKQASGWPFFLIPALIMVSLGVGVWIFFQASNPAAAPGQRHVSARQTPVVPPPAEPSGSSQSPQVAPVKALAPPALAQPVPSAQPPAANTALAQAVPPEQTAASLPAAVPAPPPAPAYKLQGIFYRPARPMAMINGVSVLSGDKVGDARVVSIHPDRVTLSVDGQTKVLTLSQKP